MADDEDRKPPEPMATVRPDYRQHIPDTDLRYSFRSQYTEISFGRLTSILNNADRGDTVEFAELCDRMLGSDPLLQSVYESRLAPIAGARWELEPGHGDPELAQLAADDCREALEQLPRFEQSLYLLLHALGVGFSVEEIMWDQRGGMVVPHELRWIHPREFRYDDRAGLYLYSDGRAYSLAPPDQQYRENGAAGMRLCPDKYLIHVPQVVPTQLPASGVLRTIAKYWWVKQWCLKYWLMGAESAGNPRPIAETPQEATPEAKRELLEALESLAADGVLVHGPGVKINWSPALAQGAGSVWSELMTRMDSAMTVLFMGSDLNVQVGSTGGNRALGESQFNATTLPRAERDGRALWSTIEHDLFKPFLKFNLGRYGGKMPPIPRGRFVLYEEPVSIDELVVKSRRVRVDELRSSRGLEPLGEEHGGNDFVEIEPVAAAPLSPLAPEADAPELPALPAPGDAAAAPAPAEKAADTALNGAQVESLLTIVERVSLGQIPRDTGIQLIITAFPTVSLERAESIMGPVGTAGFQPTPEGGQPAPAAAPAPVAAPLGGTAAVDPFSLKAKPWDVAKTAARTSAVSQTSSPLKNPNAPKR